MIYKEYDAMHREIDRDYPSKDDFSKRADYIEALKKHRTAGRAITAKFKAALLEKHGVAQHPRADMCWELAWEYGHGAGYSEVELHFDDLVKLIKDLEL